MSDVLRSSDRLQGVDDSPGTDSPASYPPWIDLPEDVTANILRRLGAVEIMKSAQKVCSTWRRVCKDPAMWRVVDLRSKDDSVVNADVLESMGVHAAERSQGQLIDITMQYFGFNKLILYIGQRANHLKRLKIVNYYEFASALGLRLAIQNLPQLEELHLFYMFSIRPGDIEFFGTCCPMLKSFSFNNRAFRFRRMKNTYARAVARSMPNLLHLQFFANKMNNDGLKAILDGCPHLESIDLRQCFDVDLSGDVGKRCYKQISNVRGPDDSTDDYEYDPEIHEFDRDGSDTEDVMMWLMGYDDF